MTETHSDKVKWMIPSSPVKVRPSHDKEIQRSKRKLI